ncbi:hypothetical protein BJ912DRAFT_969423 [Pholiota molesta]|nr:hypothetical protein BJ912DRAFT_969423 [Pholiota molesta]
MSLPPGTYTIHSQEISPRGVIPPDPDSALLDPSLFLVEQGIESFKNSWNITSTNCIIPTLQPNKNASVDVDSNPDSVPVILSARAQGLSGSVPLSINMFWHFGLRGAAMSARIDDIGRFGGVAGAFTRSIYMTSSGQNYYWGCEAASKDIRLTTEEYFWTFTPVSSPLPAAQ